MQYSSSVRTRNGRGNRNVQQAKMLSHLGHAKMQIEKRDTVRMGVVAVVDHAECLQLDLCMHQSRKDSSG